MKTAKKKHVQQHWISAVFAIGFEPHIVVDTLFRGTHVLLGPPHSAESTMS